MAHEDYIDFDPEDVKDNFGGDTVLPGYYVFQCISFREVTTKAGKENLVFQLKVVSAHKSKESELHKIHEQWIPCRTERWAQMRRAAIAMALGIKTADELRAAKDAGSPVIYDWNAGVGRFLCAEIWEGKDQDDKPKYEVRFNEYHHIDSKEAAKYPVDHKALAAISDAYQQRPDADPWTKEGRGVQQQQQTTTQASETDDSFDPFA